MKRVNKQAKLVYPEVGVERYHHALHGKTAAPVAAGHPTKTSTPPAPAPCCGAGKGFKGI